MPKKLQKSLHDYLSKIKNPNPETGLSKILSGCKHPKTPSFAVDPRNEAHGGSNNTDYAARLSDVDRFLFENFKSLYLRDDDGADNTKRFSEENHESPKLGPILFDSPKFPEPPPALRGSKQLFVRPGLSSSLVVEDVLTSWTATCDETGSSSSNTTVNDASNSHENHEKDSMGTLPGNCVAVLTYSPSPYEDFRRSMQHVAEARLRNHGRIDWDFVEKILFCYLNINDKKSYKFIINAFVDLVVGLRQRSERAPAKKPPLSVRRVQIGRR